MILLYRHACHEVQELAIAINTDIAIHCYNTQESAVRADGKLCYQLVTS